MLQSFRDNLKGTAAMVLVLLLSVPFVLVGVESLFNTSSSSVVASVNGEEITEAELNQAIVTRRNALNQQFGDNIPATMLTDEVLAGPALDSLIQRKAIIEAAKSAKMTISTLAVDEQIVAAPNFMTDGSFDPALYEQFIRFSAYTNQTFKDAMAQDLLVSQLENGVAASNFALSSEVERLASLAQQERDFAYITVKIDDLLDKVAVSDEILKQYYEDNSDQFINPEAVTLEVLELDANTLTAEIDVSDDDVESRYQMQVQDLEAKTRRRAAHILIESGRDDAEAVLEEIQAKLAQGDDFGELAAQYSDDFGSKENGGDVGFTTGETFVPEFEQALASLEVNQISDPVKTQFGQHIIKLVNLDKEPIPTLDELRMEIVQSLKAERAETLYVEKLTDFEDLTYNVEDLASVAGELGLNVQTGEKVSRQSAVGIFANSLILNVAFDQEMIESKTSSEVIELSPSSSAVVRVVEYFPQTVKPYDEVAVQIEQLVREQGASDMLADQITTAVNDINGGGSFDAVAESFGVEINSHEKASRNQPGVQRDLISQVFATAKPEDGQAVVGSVELRNGSQAIFQVTEVHDVPISALSQQERLAVAGQVAQLHGTTDLISYRNFIVDNADIEKSISED